MTGPNKSLAELGWTSFFQQQLSDDEVAHYQPVRVATVHRGGVEFIQTSAADQTVVMLPPIFLEFAEELRPTVGDWLLLAPDTHEPTRRLERTSLLRRRAAGDTGRVQAIAANVDTLFIIVSCNEDFNLARIERYLALSDDAGTYPVVVLTKADLATDADIDQLRQQATALMPGLMVECVNATDPASLEPLRSWCTTGQTIALVGSSGAGKSTLVNTLSGREIQPTQAIRQDDAKGRHTTTGRSIHPLPGGGWVIDTPGIRELSLTDSTDNLANVFAEVDGLAAQCKFSDCAHTGEPGCAIAKALKTGKLDPRRLQNYRKLIAEEAHNTATAAQRRQRGRETTKYQKSIMAQNRNKKKN